MSGVPDENKPPPRVFISYSHDSAEHCNRVLALAMRLRADGLDAQLDQFENSPPQGWPLWCARQILDSNYVLIVCTAPYRDRFLGLEGFGKGRGVKWEAKVIHNILYYEEVNSGFIPVIFDPSDEEHIPETVKDASWYLVSPNGNGSAGYTRLRERLACDTIFPPLPIPIPSEAYRHRDDASVPTEEVWDSSRRILTAINDIKSDTEKIQSGIGKLLSILENRPPPASTPERPHNLPPWMPPAYFIGRDKEMRALSEGLTASGKALAVLQPQVVYGEGGLGKTRLAIQVAWVLYLQQQCDMAFVVSASSPAELDTQLAALDAPSLLDLYKGERPPRELDIRKQNVIQALRERAGRWILVLDAADSDKARDAVNVFLGQLADGRFLVTSRREDWPRTTVNKLPLNLFMIEEARACLLSRYWKSEPPAEEIADFDRLATELGFLPLALALAASYMDSRRITPSRYLSEWKRQHDPLLDFTAGDVEHGRSLLAAFKLSYDLLNPQAARLLNMLAWLAPEPFPRQLVEDWEGMRIILSDGIEASTGNNATEALAELRTLSLLQLDDESLRLHKLVLKCARATLRGDARANACAIVLGWVNSIRPDAKYDETGWKLWNRLSPHLHGVIAVANELKIESEALVAICGDFGAWLFGQARHNEAEPLMRRALAIDQKSYGREHTKVAIGLNNLALLLQATNRLAEAEPLMRRALAIDEKSYGPDHPHVAIRLNNLAQLLKDTNRLTEAEPLMHKALAINEKSYGSEHPEVARVLNNLALLLKDTNRLAEAEPLMRRVLEIFEKSLGKDHPNVALALSNLAALLKDTNRLAEAEPLMQRALAIDEKSYGSDHPKVASDLNNLALLLQATNRLAEVKPLMRRALAIDEKRYGPDHPTVALRLNNLAQLLHDTNRLAEAEPLLQRALAIDERSYGPDHPTVALRLSNLATLLEATNRRAEAEPLMQRALAIDERSYGPDHPNVARDLGNLSALLEATNRLAEAEPLMLQALAIDERSYGPDHPNVAIRLHNLAALLRATNRLAEAEPLMQRALAIDKKSYGPNHPNVARDLHNLAELLKATNRLAEAEPLMRRVVEIFEKSLGKDHPNVAVALGNLAQLLHATNRLAEAEPLIRRVLAIDEKTYGLEHPNVAVALNNLAQLLKDTNRLAEAEPLMRRALAIDEKSCGPDHPNIARDLNNLALLLQATNRLVEVEPLMQRALAIDEKSYGPDHPNIARDLNNLAALMHATDRLAEAEPLMRRTLAIDEKNYGPEHPDVARDLNNLAQWLQATNRLAEAEPLMRRVVEIFEKSLGKDHPNVSLALNNLAQLLRGTNNLMEAERLMRRALFILAKFTKSTGHLHPHLESATGNYRVVLEAMSLGESEIARRIAEVGKEAGFDEETYSAFLAELSK